MDDITKRIDYKDLKSFIDSISYGGNYILFFLMVILYLEDTLLINLN